MLKFDVNGDSSCGVVDDPALFAPVKCRIHGCDGQMEDEPDDPEFRRRMRGYSAAQFEQRRRSILMWGLQHLVPE